MILIIVHLFLLLGVDFFIFEFDVFVIVADSILLWLNFVNYMTLNKITCGINCAIYPVCTLIAISHFQRVFFEGDKPIQVKVAYVL
jgi:hypothetical protein